MSYRAVNTDVITKATSQTAQGNKGHILKYYEARKYIPRASRGALNVQPSGTNTHSGL